MVAPNNYMLNIPDPTQSVMQGVQSGFNLVNTIQQQKANEAALAMKQAEQARIQQMNQDIGLVSSNPTPTGIASLMTKYPQMSEQFKRTYDVLSTEQQKQHVNVSSQVYAALNANKPEIAQQVLAEKAAAYRNSGDEETAKGYDVFSQLIKESPQLATTTAGMFLANAMGVDKFGETFTKMESERRERNLEPSKMTEAEAKAYQADIEARNTPERLRLASSLTKSQIKDIDSQILNRSRQRMLDEKKLQSDVDLKLIELNQKGEQYILNDTARKIINDSALNAASSAQLADTQLSLADKFDKLEAGYGLGSTTAETFAKLTGNQDYVTLLRKEYTRMKMGEALKLLPPGPATDRDVSLAMEGFIPENAGTKTIASFLRGMSKLNQYTAAVENTKAEWVNAVGSLSKPKTDIEINGVKVPKGTTFADFGKKYFNEFTQKTDIEANQKLIPDRTYNRFNNLGQ